METISVDKVNRFANWLNILSEPKRLNILNKIIEGVQCNCNLCQSLSMSPNLVSHHISILCNSGIIMAEKGKNDARWVYYSIDTETMEKLRIFFNEFFNPARIKRRLPSCGPGLIIKESVFKHED